MKIKDRIKHAWNTFANPEDVLNMSRGPSSSRAMHKNTRVYTSTSYVASIYNRIAMDVAMTTFRHVKVNLENDDTVDMISGLNHCLSIESNIDQTHIQFIQDLVYSMFDEGVVAVVPVDTTINPSTSGGYEINTMRVGAIVNWFPKHVEVELYNDEIGQNQRIIVEKKNCSIIENPLYAVVNDDNSTLKRLIRKLNQLDDIDALAASSRLDILISVPYGIKTNTQKQMAERRIADIEAQLSSGRNGIAYIDGTEKVTQLNRPANPQLLENIKTLNNQFYNQLGLTENIFNGTASESELKIYYSRAIDPIVDGIVAEFNRKFLTKTARTQGQKIIAYRDIFRTVTVESLASLADSFRRNYIGTTNEIRKIAGMKPSNDPRADELFNPNIADDRQMDKISIPKPKSEEEEKEVVKTNTEEEDYDKYNEYEDVTQEEV